MEETKVKAKLSNLVEFKEQVDLGLLQEYKDDLRNKENELNNLNDGLEVIKLARKLDNVGLNVIERDFEDLRVKYNEVTECKKALVIAKKLHILLKSLQSLRVDTKSQLRELEELKELRKTIEVTKVLGDLEVPIQDYQSILGAYNELRELNKTTQNLKKLHKIKVQELTFDNKLQSLRDLKATRSYVDKINGILQELQANKKREEEKMADIEAKLKKFKVCPLCHHSLEN